MSGRRGVALSARVEDDDLWPAGQRFGFEPGPGGGRYYARGPGVRLTVDVADLLRALACAADKAYRGTSRERRIAGGKGVGLEERD